MPPLRVLCLAAAAAVASLVPLATASAVEGPFAVAQGSYRFAERSDPLVASDRKIDYWAQVYRPTALAGKPFPLVVFLHGNHETCGRFDKELQVRVDDRSDYTDTGRCPSGYTVVPSHLGYAYVAEELASWGYVVVSINANRGITVGRALEDDIGLNLMRGRLILRHLALLSDWNRGTGQIPPPVTLGFNPVGTMDFSQIGMMGHSRGGEGVRAALQQLRDAGSPFPALIGRAAIRSLFEIAPVDGQTDRVLDADGVNSMILLPACDGDVVDLQGMRVFDRVFLSKRADPSKTFHGTAYVWGANHNAYNTEWQRSDSRGCLGCDALFPPNGRSKPQQVTATQTLVPFFRATVGSKADLTLARLFSPANPVPARLNDIANVDRGYLPRPLGADVQRLGTFPQGLSGSGPSDSDFQTEAAGVNVVFTDAAREHQTGLRVARVSWTSQGSGRRYLKLKLKGGRSFAGAAALSFRTALQCFGTICDRPASEKGEAAFGVALLDGNGQVSAVVQTDRFVRLSRPLKPYSGDWVPAHATLATVEIPLTAFRGIDLNRVTAVQFVFPQAQGTIDLADLMLVRSDPLAAVPAAPAVAALSARRAETTALVMAAPASPSPSPTADGNTIRIDRGGASQPDGTPRPGESDMVDVVLTSKRSFPVTDAFPRLTVGDRVIRGGNVGADGRTMTVRVPATVFDGLKPGANVSLSVVASSPAWQFGGLPK